MVGPFWKFLVCLFFFANCPAQIVDTSTEVTYIDEETGIIRSFDPTRELTLIVRNKSNYAADVQFDGVDAMSKLSSKVTVYPGKQVKIDCVAFQKFLVTANGSSDPLFDQASEEKIHFQVTFPNQIVLIPENAVPQPPKCVDRDEDCMAFADDGACSYSPGWMIVNCCESCDKEINASYLQDAKIRCSRTYLNITRPIWKPGDLNTFFEKLVSDHRKPHIEMNVLSSPGGSNGGIDGPWMIVFDNFLNDQQTRAFIHEGETNGYEPCTETVNWLPNTLGEYEYVVSKKRTSSNFWCTRTCQEVPEIKTTMLKISRLTKIRTEYFEGFELLKYETNQFFRSHRDTDTDDEIHNPGGPRILTFILYFNDVEEGGETYFSKLDLSIKPKRGRALLFPSVLDGDPRIVDERMVHESKDVSKGVKYAANYWLHLHNFETARLWGCTGNFA